MHHVSRKFCCDLPRNVADLGAHDIIDLDRIAVILVARIPL